MDTAIKNLSIEEKIALLEELLEEIERERKFQLSEVQLKHIHSRFRVYETSTEKGKSWDELKSKYLAQKDLLDERKHSHLEKPNEGISLNQFIARHLS